MTQGQHSLSRHVTFNARACKHAHTYTHIHTLTQLRNNNSVHSVVSPDQHYFQVLLLIIIYFKFAYTHSKRQHDFSEQNPNQRTLIMWNNNKYRDNNKQKSQTTTTTRIVL